MLCRHEQRIDSLFSKGTLRRLDRLGLSAFYQTVDNKSVQRICSEQLSSQSLAELHLTRVDLSHCYQVGDAGVQWLVGSRHSPRLLELDLSGTDVTGNCFLRRLPELRKLRMEGCVSLCGAGLVHKKSFDVFEECSNAGFFLGQHSSLLSAAGGAQSGQVQAALGRRRQGASPKIATHKVSQILGNSN